MSQGLFYNDLSSRKIRAQAEAYFLKNLLFTKMVCFAETFLFALFFSGSSFWLHPYFALREVNFKSSPLLLPAALRLPLNGDAASVIAAKPPPFPPCTIPGGLLPSETPEITQTSGEPRWEQSTANTRLGPLAPEAEGQARIPQ